MKLILCRKYAYYLQGVSYMTIAQLRETLDRMESGKYTGIKISKVTDQIAWLWKWRKISREEMKELTEQAIRILETMR